MTIGRILCYDKVKGYGWIKSVEDKLTRSTWFHVTFLPGGEPLPDGTELDFDIVPTPQGYSARNITFATNDKPAFMNDVILK